MGYTDASLSLHVAGVLASSVMHRENLVRAMITGSKPARPNGRESDVDTNMKTRHARFPLPNPLPEGEGANESLRESRTNEGIRRAHAWLGVIMLVLVAAFWLGYPATGLVQPNSNAAQAEHHHDDD